MDNYLGDLADIVRASRGINTTTTTTATNEISISGGGGGWEFGDPTAAADTNQESSYHQLIQDLYPFPLLLHHHQDIIDDASNPAPPFVHMDMDMDMDVDMGAAARDRDDNNNISGPMVSASTPSSSSSNSNLLFSNIFSSRMFQISPLDINTSGSGSGGGGGGHSSNLISNNCDDSNSIRVPIPGASPKVVKTRSLGFMSNQMIMSCNNTNNNNNGSRCSSSPRDNSLIGGTTGVEIPSPPTSGIKRRKSQAKKVVCIPAAAGGATSSSSSSSRQTGEVVPSDLWAWRKYGQKPIKGSPYPRGYYRCSSSKGCSARKQVERSRTDPNMLVVTYTSEHNHPWPTQRNALAGSSRSSSSPHQPSKATTPPLFSSPPQSNHHGIEGISVKKEMNNMEVKHENDMDRGMVEKEKSIEQRENKVLVVEKNEQEYEDDGEMKNNYRPTIVMPEKNNNSSLLAQCDDQDFFRDLVQFEGDDPLNLLFKQQTNKGPGSDPFRGFFDWTQNIATSNNPNHAADYDDQNNASK